MKVRLFPSIVCFALNFKPATRSDTYKGGVTFSIDCSLFSFQFINPAGLKVKNARRFISLKGLEF